MAVFCKLYQTPLKQTGMHPKVFLIVLQIATTTEEFVFILDSKDTFFGGGPCFEAKSSPDIGRLRRTVRSVHVIRIFAGMSRCQKRSCHRV